MKQEVNFYQEQFYEKKIAYSFQTMQKTLVAVVVFAVVINGLLYSLSNQSEKKRNLLRDKDQNLSQSIRVLTKQVASQKVDPELERSVTFANKQILAKQQVLNLIFETSEIKPNIFSDLLLGLSRQHVKGLWLRHIYIDKGGDDLLLEGSTLEAGMLPTYIGKLTMETVFLGRQFETLILTRKEETDHKIDFVLNTSKLDDRNLVVGTGLRKRFPLTQ